MKFVFVNFFMIVVIFQSKWNYRATLRSDSVVMNVSEWCFLKFHYHEHIQPYTVTLKNEVFSTDDSDFGTF